MLKKLLVVLFFFFISINSIHVNAQASKYVEFFDPKQDKVVKIVQSNWQIQNLITSWITNIDRLYKNDPATDDGYVVKVPLDPIVKDYYYFTTGFTLRVQTGKIQ